MALPSEEEHGPVYEIKVLGRLAPAWSDWFDARMTIVTEQDITTLTGPIPDQAALRGILCKIWDIGLTLLSVNLCDDVES